MDIFDYIQIRTPEETCTTYVSKNETYQVKCSNISMGEFKIKSFSTLFSGVCHSLHFVDNVTNTFSILIGFKDIGKVKVNNMII